MLGAREIAGVVGVRDRRPASSRRSRRCRATSPGRRRDRSGRRGTATCRRAGSGRSARRGRARPSSAAVATYAGPCACAGDGARQHEHASTSAASDRPHAATAQRARPAAASGGRFGLSLLLSLRLRLDLSVRGRTVIVWLPARSVTMTVTRVAPGASVHVVLAVARSAQIAPVAPVALTRAIPDALAGGIGGGGRRCVTQRVQRRPTRRSPLIVSVTSGGTVSTQTVAARAARSGRRGSTAVTCQCVRPVGERRGGPQRGPGRLRRPGRRRS